MTSSMEERDAKILQLVDSHTPGAIAKILVEEYPTITRNVIVGVIARKADKSPEAVARRKANADHLRKQCARRVRSAAERPPIPFIGKAAAPKPAPPRPVGATSSVPLPKRVEAAFVPLPGSRPVSAHLNRGCKWPVDGEGRELLYCNEPRCWVARPGQAAQQVGYCETHWDMRRQTRHTRVVSPPRTAHKS